MLVRELLRFSEQLLRFRFLLKTKEGGDVFQQRCLSNAPVMMMMMMVSEEEDG